MNDNKDFSLRFRITTEKLKQLDEQLKKDGYNNRAEWFNEQIRKYLKEGAK